MSVLEQERFLRHCKSTPTTIHTSTASSYSMRALTVYRARKWKLLTLTFKTRTLRGISFPMFCNSEHKTQEIPLSTKFYITLALVQKISVESSFATSTGIWKYYHPCFTELSYFLKSKDMLETLSVKQRTKTSTAADKGKPWSANIFINSHASCVCCSRKETYRKIFLKSSLRGVLISEALPTASCFLPDLVNEAYLAHAASCIISTLQLFYCCLIRGTWLFKKLVKINSTARYCETTTHWLPKYRNMLQYSISTDSWEQQIHKQNRAC